MQEHRVRAPRCERLRRVIIRLEAGAGRSQAWRHHAEGHRGRPKCLNLKSLDQLIRLQTLKR